MTTNTKLGKIESVEFGLGGYNNDMLGLTIVISGKGWGVVPSEPQFWDSNLIEWNYRCKWTEDDRDKQFAIVMRRISDLLKDAKVDTINKLVGIPVEAIFNGFNLKSWRILTEVL